MLDLSNDSTSFHQLVFDWISEVETLPHESVRRVLREELGSLNIQQGDSDGLEICRESVEHTLNALKLRLDPKDLRSAAVLLTSTIDLSVLYSLLDTSCTLTVMFGTERAIFHSVEHVIEELCEEQESILGLSADSPTYSNTPTLAQGVSPLQTWIHKPRVGMGVQGCCSQVGTFVTYFRDDNHKYPLFSLQTLVSFTPDGYHVNSIERILLIQDVHADIIRTSIHFGPFLANKSAA